MCKYSNNKGTVVTFFSLFRSSWRCVRNSNISKHSSGSVCKYEDIHHRDYRVVWYKSHESPCGDSNIQWDSIYRSEDRSIVFKEHHERLDESVDPTRNQRERSLCLGRSLAQYLYHIWRCPTVLTQGICSYCAWRFRWQSSAGFSCCGKA